MLLVNPQTAFQWVKPLDINGIAMMGIREKQGHSFNAKNSWTRSIVLS